MAEEIRRSQIITTFGIGAISDLKDFSGVLKSPDVWDDKLVKRLENEEKINDARLAKALGVDYFLMPPSNIDDKPAWLPITLFPRYLYCPTCSLMMDVDDWFPNGLPRYKNNGDFKPWELNCPNCLNNRNKRRSKLIPSRFITICPKGHLYDFPYYKWVHDYGQCKNEQQGKPKKFKFWSSGGGASLSDIRVKCLNCNVTKTLSGALSSEAHLGKIKRTHGEDDITEFTCDGFLPEKHDVYSKPENCGVGIKHLSFVPRNASKVYFPKIYTSLLIPPYNDSYHKKFEENFLFEELKRYLRENENEKAEKRRQWLVDWGKDELNLDDNTINNILDDLLNTNEEYEPEKYKYEEYIAFLNFNSVDTSDNFVIKEIGFKKLKKINLSRLLRCERIREIKVLYGYSRVRPYDKYTFSENSEENFPKPNIALKRVSSYSINWLPGVEYFGEGIFLSFDNELMNKIENNQVTKKRISILENNLRIFHKESNMNFGNINARFVGLHTLAHLIIKRVSFLSGYGLSSLRERIYCNVNDIYNPMNGILIYVADTDSVGTLGGLARMANDDKLNDIITEVFEESEWCSSDPVCRESKGQGMGALNLAACHSCCLLPETSCEYGNRFLDREIMEYFFLNE